MSVGEINGDDRLSPGKRLRYLWINLDRNLSGWQAIPVQRFGGPLHDGISPVASPSRALTEVFIRTALPSLLPPRPLRILDIGCGSGRLAALMASAGLTGAYTGVDVYDRFNLEPVPGMAKQLVLGDAAVVTLPGPFDLAISVSALEHIPDDRLLLGRLADQLEPSGIHVHVVPSGTSLFLFLWHGLRQYTRRSIADRLGQPPARLFGLGGIGSLLVHFAWVTVPENLFRLPLRQRLPLVYKACRSAGFAIDRVLPFLPTMYVVVANAGPSHRQRGRLSP